MFNKLNIEDYRQCAKHLFHHLNANGHIRPNGLTGYNERSYREDVINDAVVSVISGELFEYGQKNRAIKECEVDALNKQEQMNLLCVMMKRYIGEKYRPHRVSISGKRVKSTFSDNEISATNEDNERVSFMDTVVDGDNERSERNYLMRDVLNYHLNRLNDDWYKAIKFILDDVMDSLTTTSNIKKGKFGSYISKGEDGRLNIRVSRDACREASQYVHKSEWTVRDKFYEWLKELNDVEF